VVSITCSYVPLDLILPDQPNRAVRTRMLRGVGGAACEGRSYPDRRFLSIMVADGEIRLNLFPCPLLHTLFAVVVICF